MRIIGIDCGSFSVKAVEIETAFRKFEIHDYYEEPIHDSVKPMEVVKKMLASLPKPPDKIVLSMPSNRMTFRNLRLPTKDKKAIAANIRFELEDDLPFDLDETIHAYSIIEQSRKGVRVHITATLKKYVGELLEEAKSIGLDPDVVTTEPWAFRTLFETLNLDKDSPDGTAVEPKMLIQMGKNTTVVYVHFNGEPVFLQTLKWGGADITRAISQKYGINEEEAEKAKLESGFVLVESQRGQASEEQVAFSDVILESMKGLQQEVRQANLTCKNYTLAHISKVYIAGGTSMIPGMRNALEEILQIPVESLKGLTGLSNSDVKFSDATEAGFLKAAALATCVAHPGKAKIINLRLEEFAKEGEKSEFKIPSLKTPLLASGAVFSCFLVSMFVQSMIYDKRSKQIDIQMGKAMKSFFKVLSPSASRTYLMSPSKLKNAVEKELEGKRAMASLVGGSQSSPLGFLKTISKDISKSLEVDLKEFKVGSDPGKPFTTELKKTANLTFVVPSLGVADQVENILKTRLAELKKVGPKEIGKNQYEVVFTGSPLEGSYGN